MNDNLKINARTFFIFWLIGIGIWMSSQAVFTALYSARTALLIIGISFFFAIALSTPVNWLVKIIPGKSRVLSTAISYLVVIVFMGLLVFLVIPPVVEQTAKFVKTIPSLVDDATSQSVTITKFIDRYDLQPEFDRVLVSVKNGATSSVSSVGTYIVSSIGSVVSMVTAVILVLVLTFLMLVEGPEFMSKLWALYRNRERMEHHRRLVHKMYSIVTGYVTGQLTVAAIAGVVAGLVVFILSAFLEVPPNLAVPSATIVFVSSLIPMFGAMIGALLVSTILVLNNITSAIVFIVFFILYQQLEANYISPKIHSKRVDLSILMVLIAVTIGIYLFGIIGGIISIPVAGCIKILFEDYLERSSKKIQKA